MKRSKRKQEIYRVSTRLFRKKGYSASSMRDIAEHVGLEPSSLYSHIKSKEEILIDICFDCASLFEEGMIGILKTYGRPAERLDALVDLHLDIAYNKPSSVTVFNDEWRHLPEPKLSEFLAVRKTYEDQFRQIIKDGIVSGDFEQISSSTAINVVINSLKWLHFYTGKRDQAAYDLKRQEVKKFVQKGLGI